MKKWIVAAAVALALTLLALAAASPSSPPPPTVRQSPITCRTLPSGAAVCSQQVSVHSP